MNSGAGRSAREVEAIGHGFPRGGSAIDLLEDRAGLQTGPGCGSTGNDSNDSERAGLFVDIKGNPEADVFSDRLQFSGVRFIQRNLLEDAPPHT